MKNFLTPKPKPQTMPREFASEPQTFVLVFRQAREDYIPLRRMVFRAMRPLERLSAWFFPFLCAIQIPWLWSQIQTTGWPFLSLKNNWFSLVILALLGHSIVQELRARQQFFRFVEKFPHRTLVVFPSGCVVFASDERGQHTQPPMTFFSSLWKDVVASSNTHARAILVGQDSHAILISNRICACSCEVAQASRLLDELLAPPVKNSAPIAEPN